jgi:hypothetical protein
MRAGRATRTIGLAGVVLATLIALVAPMPAAAVIPGTAGLIAFVSSRDHVNSGSDIYVMNADGTNPSRLTTDGSNPVNLTKNPAYDSAPHWGVLATQHTATTTALDVTPASPVAAGTPETLKATVTPVGTAGSVQFKDGTTTIGAPVTVTSSTATFTTTLPPGTHALTAVFTPNDPTRFASSTSTAVSYVVSIATGAKATTTTLTVFPTPAFEGISVVLLANVAPRGAAGTLQFKDGATALGPPVPASAGFALLITPLPAGMHSLTVVFTPTNSAALAPSTSSPVSLVVNPFF